MRDRRVGRAVRLPDVVRETISHVTIVQPAFWLLIIAAVALVFLAMKLQRAHS